MRHKIIVNMVSESDTSVKAHGVHTAYVELASALEKRNDVKLILGAFGKKVDCDIVHLHTIGPRIWRKLFQSNVKKVISAHVVPASFIGSIRGAKYWSFAAVWYMKWIYGRADKVLAVSSMVADALENELGIPNQKIEVFYNSIDMDRYVFTKEERKQARRKLGISEESFVVLGNGQVQPRKRLDTFQQMAKHLPEIQFIWVGGIPFKQLGADYSAMKKLAESSTDNFHVTGVIDHSLVRDYLIAADVFCLPAEQENHPMCVLEAAGAGLPIVLRDIPEYDDTFKRDAIRCDDESFAREIQLLSEDKTYYAAWQNRSKAIRRRFDSRQSAGELMKIYQDLL